MLPSTDEGELTGDPAATLDELHLAERGEAAVFCGIGPGVVDPAQRAVADAALHMASDVLGIDAPELYWFDREPAGHRAYVEKWGWRDWEWFPGSSALAAVYVEPFGELWLRRGLGELETVRVVAREVRWAARDGMSREVCESEADAFADRIAAAFTKGMAAASARADR